MGAWVQDSSNSVAVGGDNYGPIHIGDSADPSAAAAQSLADVVQRAWEEEAELRGIATGLIDVRWKWADFAPRPGYVFREPLAGGTPRPLPGITPRPGQGASQPGTVKSLFSSVYAQLPHGRLAIAGEASAGKSSMMLALMIGLLDHRGDLPASQRDRCPVPVWLSATDWEDPGHEPLRAWVTRMLARQYGHGLAATAATLETLLATGRLALFIDGIDELRPGHRAAALRRLDNEERGTRIVVTCRTAEFQQAGGGKKRNIPLAVITPLPVDAGTASAFLLSGHPADQGAPPELARLAAQIQADPASPAAVAVRSPHALSLIRDVYATDGDPAELLDASRFACPAEVQGYLLARFLDCAYPEHDAWAADRHWLRWLAAQMGDDRNLRWWQIPDWTPAWRRRGVLTLLSALLVCAALGLAVSAAGAVAGGVLGAVRSAFLFPLKKTAPRWNPRRPTPGELAAMLGLGIAQGGLCLALAFALSPLTVAAAAIILAVANSLVYLVTRVWSADVTDDDDLAPARSEASSRRARTLAGVTFGLSMAASNAVWAWAFCALLSRQAPDLHHLISGTFTVALALAFGLTAGCAAGLPIFWHTSLTMSELFFRLTGRPVHFMALLQRAHNRKILRQAGSIYQFRSAELQAELASQSVTRRVLPAGDRPRYVP